MTAATAPAPQTQKQPCQVFRIAKRKGVNIHNCAAHASRQKMPTWANPEMTSLNRNLIGDPNSIPEYMEYLLSTCKRKIKQDAVKLVEVLLTASPEYFRPDDPSQPYAYDESRLNAWLEAQMKFIQEQFGERCISATLHLDERTPHIHAFVVPINDLEGKRNLSCKAFFGDEEKLSQWQDTYHEYVKHLGLARGEKGSNAQHEDVAAYYRRTKATERQRCKERGKEIAIMAEFQHTLVGQDVTLEGGYSIKSNDQGGITVSNAQGPLVITDENGRTRTASNVNEQHLEAFRQEHKKFLAEQAKLSRAKKAQQKAQAQHQQSRKDSQR